MARLEKAFYNQIPFYIEENEYQSGRRIAKFEFPYRDLPYTEDLGRKSKTHVVDGFITGADIYPERDRLLAELESNRPGTLIHPYYGELKVRVEYFRVTESSSKNRIVKFSVTFCELGSPDSMTKTDKQANFQIRADEIKKDLYASVLSRLGDGVLSLQSAAGFAQGFKSKLSDKLQASNNFLDRIWITEGVITASYSNKFGVLDDLNGIMSSLLKTISVFSRKFVIEESTNDLSPERLETLLESSGIKPSNEAGPQIDQEPSNEHLVPLIQVTLIIEISGALLSSETLTEFEIDSSAALVLDYLDRLMLDLNITNEMLFLIAKLRAELILSIQNKKELLSIRSLQLTHDSNSLVLAYNLYGNIAREEEILRLNKITNPAFLDKGTFLKVRSS